MHPANQHYGHGHALARYCGLPGGVPDRIRGYVQHGWNPGEGFGERIVRLGGFPSFVWSSRTRRRSIATGRRNVVVTGAPWLYLLAVSPPPAAERAGTIWYPFHGWEAQEVLGDHGRLVDHIRAVEPGPVTVCLYWHEYQNLRLRRRYERAGFRVICHGSRGGPDRPPDPGFLIRQLGELVAHRRVASNRLTTAVLYGASVGCEPAVYGDPMVIENDWSRYGDQARARREWPMLHGEQVDVRAAREAALAELGHGELREPDELRHLLGWRRRDGGEPS